jgi:hypothetical protein
MENAGNCVSISAVQTSSFTKFNLLYDISGCSDSNCRTEKDGILCDMILFGYHELMKNTTSGLLPDI